ncbi:MAG: hypothetical protein KC466_14865, partial [Myxococcales bacterium]|nr:hypothetical protein [Myxococcales bacterium]
MLDTLTFSADWDPDEAHPLSVGPDDTGASGEDLNVNNLTDVCCAPGDFPGPACVETTTCVDDETDHTLRGWEDGGSISFDGADLVYGYGQFDVARYVLCASTCTADCDTYCGREVLGAPRDNTTKEFDLYEAAVTSGAWLDKGPTRTGTPDTASNEFGPSTNHDGTILAFSRTVENTGLGLYHNDIFLSTLTGSPSVWDTPAAVSAVNTDVCNENNPHVVNDVLSGDEGLRLYFDSDRDPNASPWDEIGDCLTGGERRLWVARREESGTWGTAVQVNLPAVEDTQAWSIPSRTSPFVTANNPDGASRYLYWAGREDDCATAGSPALGCIYRADQSGDQAIDDAWSNVTLVVKPTPYAGAVGGDVIYVDHPSVTGDGEYLHFTYIEPVDPPADVDPPIDTGEPLEDADDGLQFVDEWWQKAYALDHPANFDAGSGDTSGWEDSVNIMADGRKLYFGYSTFLFGQGSKVGPVPEICGDPTGSCPGRAVYPRFLANADVTRPTNPFQSTVPEKLGLSIYEATIDTGESPTEWQVEFSSINYATYCVAPASCGTPCQNPCLTRDGIDDDLCWNDSGAQVLVDGGNPGVAHVLKTTQGAPDLNDPRCVTPEEQGMMEGAVTVSVDSNGKERMLFVRYGDLRDLTADPANAPLSVHLPKIMESVRDCDEDRDTGGGDYWCIPTAASFNNTVSCIDNDPHLTAGATSV